MWCLACTCDQERAELTEVNKNTTLIKACKWLQIYTNKGLQICIKSFQNTTSMQIKKQNKRCLFQTYGWVQAGTCSLNVNQQPYIYINMHSLSVGPAGINSFHLECLWECQDLTSLRTFSSWLKPNLCTWI